MIHDDDNGYGVAPGGVTRGRMFNHSIDTAYDSVNDTGRGDEVMIDNDTCKFVACRVPDRSKRTDFDFVLIITPDGVGWGMFE